MCLQCHGLLNIRLYAETDKYSKTFYSEDVATGYNSNEFRRFWHVNFNK